MMKIAVYHSLHSGGAKRTLFEQLKRIACRHQFDLFSLSSADNDFCDIRPYVLDSHIYRFDALPLFRSPFGRLNQFMRLVDLIRLQGVARLIAEDIDNGDYDVVFVHPSRYTQSPLVLRYLNTPAVYYCQEPLRKLYEESIERPYNNRAWYRRVLDKIDIFNWSYETVLRRLDQASLKSATLILINSHFSRNNVRRIYKVESVVSYHGVDVDLFRPMNLDRRKIVLSVGALKPLKGFDFVIESLGRISFHNRPALYIVSNYQEPQELAYLTHAADQEGVEVFFCTMVDDRKLVELYNSASMVAYAPIREPFGLVPLESMACGTPVVAVSEGGVSESVRHEETGLLTERDQDHFASAMQTLLEDEALARRYGNQARQYVVEKWSWEKATDVLEEHLVEVANQKI